MRAFLAALLLCLFALPVSAREIGSQYDSIGPQVSSHHQRSARHEYGVLQLKQAKRGHERMTRVAAPDSVIVPPAIVAVHSGLVTVATAANIAVTVAADFAPKIEGFIRDIVALGYQPKHIGCYAHGGHVKGSLHYSGNACDFDQTGWNRVAANARVMYSAAVTAIAHRWGLRSGCEFQGRKDCGHIDAGFSLAAHYHRHRA